MNKPRYICLLFIFIIFSCKTSEPNIITSDDVKLWFDAAKSGDTDSLQRILDKGIDINVTDFMDMNAAFYAIQYGHQDNFFFLEKKGINLNQINRMSQNTLNWAILYKNDEAVIETLIAKGADIFIQDAKGRTISYAIIENGDLSLLDKLAGYGYDINYQSTHDQRNILHYAICSGSHIKVIEELINRNINLYAEDANGNNSLLSAIDAGRKDVIKRILNSGFDINHKNSRGVTALWYAVDRQYNEIVEMLIDLGVDIYLKNDENRSVYDWAVSWKDKWKEHDLDIIGELVGIILDGKE